jgi:DinB superfamily
MATIPQTKESVLRQLSESEESAAKLILGVSPTQARWQAEPGKSWNIWQCLDHLVLTNRIYTAAIMQTVASGVPTRGTAAEGISPGWFGRWFISQLDPPARRRIKTLPAMKPPEEGSLEQAQREFIASHEEVREVLKHWDKVDFNRARFRSPFAPVLRFTVGTGLLIINAHDRRHLWQADQVKQTPGYPKS